MGSKEAEAPGDHRRTTSHLAHTRSSIRCYSNTPRLKSENETGLCRALWQICPHVHTFHTTKRQPYASVSVHLQLTQSEKSNMHVCDQTSHLCFVHIFTSTRGTLKPALSFLCCHLCSNKQTMLFEKTGKGTQPLSSVLLHFPSPLTDSTLLMLTFDSFAFTSSLQSYTSIHLSSIFHLHHLNCHFKYFLSEVTVQDH